MFYLEQLCAALKTYNRLMGVDLTLDEFVELGRIEFENGGGFKITTSNSVITFYGASMMSVSYSPMIDVEVLKRYLLSKDWLDSFWGRKFEEVWSLSYHDQEFKLPSA